MKCFRMLAVFGLIATLTLTLMPTGSWAQGVYGMTAEQIAEYKDFFDDPTAMYEAIPQSKVVPPDIYQKYVYDVEEMKKIWSEVVQFKAPDEVGKIAPEIKPGKYTYQDKDKLPFKDLMIDLHYERFAPGEPPYIGNYPEITVVPTRQYYYAKPIAEATLKHMGETKLEDQGYLVYDSYTAGFPFGRPSGDGLFLLILKKYSTRKEIIFGQITA